MLFPPILSIPVHQLSFPFFFFSSSLLLASCICPLLSSPFITLLSPLLSYSVSHPAHSSICRNWNCPQATRTSLRYLPYLRYIPPQFLKATSRLRLHLELRKLHDGSRPDSGAGIWVCGVLLLVCYVGRFLSLGCCLDIFDPLPRVIVFAFYFFWAPVSGDSSVLVDVRKANSSRRIAMKPSPLTMALAGIWWLVLSLG